MEEKKTIPVTPPVTVARRVFPVDGRDRALLVLAWGVGVLCAEALLWGLSGLGMTLLAAAWYGVLFWYGGAAPLARRENRHLRRPVHSFPTWSIRARTSVPYYSASTKLSSAWEARS